MNFLSPSFYHYIDIESHTHKIKVLDTFTDRLICVLPQHMYKFMYKKQESFSTETFVNKMIFIDEDFIWMELDQSSEILFHVPTGRTISSFNVLSRHLKYNEKLFPVQFHAHNKQGGKSKVSRLVRKSTSWIKPSD